MPIHAVIFDMGGVILRTEDLSGRRKWARRFGMGEWELAEAVFNSEAAAAATGGHAPAAAGWEAARRRFHLSAAELIEFQSDFWSGDRFDEALLDWVASLRGRYRTAILSNAWSGARDFLTGQPGVVRAFETLIISAEEGVRKPQEEIYARTAQRLNVLPGQAVFVDDVLENVEAARACGWLAIHFQPGLNVPQELAQMGVK